MECVSFWPPSRGGHGLTHHGDSIYLFGGFRTEFKHGVQDYPFSADAHEKYVFFKNDRFPPLSLSLSLLLARSPAVLPPAHPPASLFNTVYLYLSPLTSFLLSSFLLLSFYTDFIPFRYDPSLPYYLDDLWVFSVDSVATNSPTVDANVTGLWREIKRSPGVDWPPARTGHSLVSTDNGNSLMLFGGYRR